MPLDLERRLAAARAGDAREFASLTEPHRRELQVHCYRIVGSLQDAEDLVQETLLRAWRRLDTYAGRASFRAWLYKIATNACLDSLDKRPRRSLPPLAAPPADPTQPPAPPRLEPIWLEPLPDDLLAGVEESPEARYTVRESVTLAFLAALHTLPPRQRAVLLLCDVLDWRASEAADTLGLTVSAVNSALHRARKSLAEHYHGQGREAVRAVREDAHTRGLLERYLQAWESADISMLVRLLQEDVIFAMPPAPAWFRGRDAVREGLLRLAFASEAARRWRLVPTHANAGPALAVYQRDPAGVYRAAGVQTLTLADGLIAEAVFFLQPHLLAHFGLPAQLE